MYTDKETYNYQNYDENEKNYKGKNNTIDIIIKIVLIILCVLALIWLFKLLKGSKNETVVYNDNLHDSNITLVRLASERYFFINNNLPDGNNVKTISLQTLINEKLLNNIVDGNNKVCNNTKSVVSLNKENSSYLMRINLSCSLNQKEEKFYYDYITYKCTNCNGKTYMTGEKEEEKNNNDNNNNSNDNGNNNNDNSDYSCTEWSNWQTNRVNNSQLTERTRTLVRGIKRGTTKVQTTYGNWSDFSTTPIKSTDNLEVETKRVETGSGTKVVTKERKEPDKVVKSCPSGYTRSGDKCYSAVKTGDLGYSEYGKYDILNANSVETKTEKNSQGKWEVVYKNCSYRTVTDVITTVIPGKTVTYTEQVPTKTYTTYYRSRTVTRETVSEGDIITDDYYEENKLPEGYEKYPGSEKIEYSYKLTTCVK